MKKIFTLSAVICASLCVNAQVSFSDNFDAYTAGQYLAVQSQAVGGPWTTWSNAPGGTEDVLVSNTDASSGANSVYYSCSTASGGPTDCVLPFGGQYTTGTFVYEQKMKFASGKGGYFNFQADQVIGTLWALEVYVNQTGQFQMSNTNGTLLTGTFPNNTWFTLTFDINLNTNQWNVKVNNTSVGIFANTVNQIASIDIFPVNASTPIGGNNQAGFWIDDVNFSYTPYVLPTLNAGVVAVGVLNPATRTPGTVSGIVGQTRPMSATVRNLGVNTITSFDLALSFNAVPQSMSFPSVSIPSMATYVVTFNVPVTFVAGSNVAVVTVSNVNGLGPDGDLNDDVNTASGNITTVPAPGKMVVGEEGTGTWCQWCPRGAVYMDYMAESYDGFWAGIAVHNGDPMTDAAYDTGIGALITGYPSALVDRGAAIDPSTVEGSFLTRVQIAPHATITNGAKWNTAHDTLFVSVTYTFTQAATSSYKGLAVITEDSVTGTSGYAQANAYGNNANGPMGGFELFGTSVPAASMNYNHVARGIAPNFNGASCFYGTVPVASVLTANFAFPIQAGWDTSMFHVTGILVGPTGTFDNAGRSSLAEALSNGWVPATTGVSVAEIPSQPEDIKVYPNPSNGTSFVELNLDAPQEVTMTIRDVTGKVVGTHSYGTLGGANILPIYTSELATGVYTVEVMTGETLHRSQMIVQ